MQTIFEYIENMLHRSTAGFMKSLKRNKCFSLNLLYHKHKEYLPIYEI